MNIDNCIENMLLRIKNNQRRIWLGLAACFVITFSFYVMLCFIVGSDLLGMNVRSLGAMLDGTAITPHVYRQLVPVIANIFIGISPESLQEGVTHILQGWIADRRSTLGTMVSFHHPSGAPPELTQHLYAFVVVNIIDYLFLMGYVYYVWKLARQLFPDFFSVQVMAPCFAILAIPPFCAKFAYIYDFPVLFFSAWLTYVLLQKRLLLFTLGVGLATFNKETSIYLITLFAVAGWWELPRRTWKMHLLCQCLLLVVVKGGVTIYYHHNPGEFLWVRGLYDHIITNMDGYSVYTFLGLMATVLLLGCRWRQQPLLLQCWVAMVPFSVLSWLIFGMRYEYRVMYELFPALLLVACHNIAYLLQVQQEPLLEITEEA